VTAPFQRPSVEGVLGNHEKRIGTLEAVAPPSVASGGYPAGATKYALTGQDWWWYRQGGDYSGFTAVTDTTKPYTGYFESTAQNAYFIFGAPISPVNGLWCVDFWIAVGTDYGKFDLEWQTTPSNVVGETDQAVKEPDSTGTWYNTGSPFTGWQYDAYAAVPSDFLDTQYCRFDPVGTPGTMLTADGVQDTRYLNAAKMNGGGDGDVWWWLRLKVKTKHASSAGYRCRVYGIQIRRIATLGVTIN